VNNFRLSFNIIANFAVFTKISLIKHILAMKKLYLQKLLF